MKGLRGGIWSCLLVAQTAASPTPDVSRRAAEPHLITGLYSSAQEPAQIVIHDTAGKPSWTWSVKNAKGISSALLQCMYSKCKKGLCVAPEQKWADGGNRVLAIQGTAAFLINHHPGRPTDKQVTFGICLNRDGMENSHTAELLPDGKMVLSTTNDAMTGNLRVFDTRAGQDVDAAPVQELDGIPATHSLVWDSANSLLWAASNDKSPQSPGSRSILTAYKYSGGRFDAKPQVRQVISPAKQLTEEWGQNTPWWDGAHTMAPIPGQRKLLVSTDSDVHAYDIGSGKLEHGGAVVQKYLGGFQPVGTRGSLPRSDIKSVSFLPDGKAVYVQARWGAVTGTQVNVLAGGKRQDSIFNQELYKSRWFTGTTW
ncbi:uncharacterized protein UV8b_04983 [Ustilaginoidea virens]|uniref:Uncharacterized protein n=1 Tax=Ustilaginoidea virens TaxID=1159556 RepID=A0A063BTF5_USTVR|nr:uncharacterized protein UV8b_04983 [Ustilaginoidea virens]QUC20742.1 hypothetical protein UV8b_04983 [Ustilaginoidea virens]GAO19261.1 hypothetical protein UVI_02062430 [Ustilaginoidea virens]